MNLVSIPERDEIKMFQEFYNTSAFTFEGLDISDKDYVKRFKKEFEDVARATGFTEKKIMGYFFRGESMNKRYNLTGDNAYPDDLTFVVIPNYYNPLVKIKLGARWFDDIVDSNSIRQRAINCGCEPDYN